MTSESMQADANTASNNNEPQIETKGDVETKQEQEQTKKETTSQQSQKGSKPRHRASVACASCRDRRIRCVVPPGEKECTQCKRSGVECVIKNDDERRRPISRAYMCSLTERVALLESMLKEKGTEPPPANHPPKTRHGSQRNEDASPNRKAPDSQNGQQETPSPGSQPSPQEDFLDIDPNDNDNGSHQGEVESAGSPSMIPPPKKDGMVSRLLSTRGHLSFDQLSGRLRYFGPTTNCHVHSELNNPQEANQQTTEHARRAEKVIRSLPMETYEYLMELFWQCYNPVIHVLHQEAFNEDRENGRTQFYSGFLHICVLATGFKYADKNRPDIRRLALPGMESTLHREAKYMLDVELERPGGIPSVVAMLLLGDLECGVGRDNLGWLYGGLAVRLAFDIGLHLDTRASGLPEREIEIRQMTLWACVIYDKYWALFLGRPTSMKSSDLEIYHLSKQFERLGTCRPAGHEKSLETMIYEALLDLMELAGKITENMDPRSQHAQQAAYQHSYHQMEAPESAIIDRNQYLRMAALDREFSNWYARLPEQLRWTPGNIATAPFSFFLLHQQYHSSLILLHRPFAMYEDQAAESNSSNGSAGGGASDDHFSALSRTVCTKHAIRVARIFWQHRQRFDTKQIFVTGLQHAGTAATALVAALAFIKDPNDRNNNMQYLECLSAALHDMAETYQPASRMSGVLRAVMVELRGEPVDHVSKLYKHKSALVPARRGSTIDSDGLPDVMPPMYKKHRQGSRGSSTRAGTGTGAGSGMGGNGGGRKRTSSMTNNAAGGHPHINLDLSIKPPPPPRFDDPFDRSSDGFIMVTPRSEYASWPPVPAHSHGSLSSDLDHNMHTPSTVLSTSHSHSSRSNPTGGLAWMGAEFDASDEIAQLAGVHFPEINAALEGGDMSHLDYLSLGGDGGGAGSEWVANGEWGSAVGGAGAGAGAGAGGAGSDLDGFPPQGNFGVGEKLGVY